MGQGKKSRKRRGNQVENGSGQVHQQDDGVKKPEKEIEEKEDGKPGEYGQVVLEDNRRQRKIHLITIIGEMEGHENSSGSSKTTKCDHIPSKLVETEDDDSVNGPPMLLNTSGGDVGAGLAIAEMIASPSLPTVSPVLDRSHSVGVSLAMSTNYSFIMLSGTVMIRPMRMTGIVIGTSQTYEYSEMVQNRILTFVSNHADIAYDQLRELMHNTKVFTGGPGTVLVRTQAVEAGLINQAGGIKGALGKLHAMVDKWERGRQIPS